MTRAYYASIVVSSTLFLFYGIACLTFDRMKRDFERFGLGRLRTLAGTLEVAGALGLLAGFLWPPLLPLSAGGLALMMLVGIVARIRVLDSLAQTLPALVLMFLNLFIVWYALGLAGRDG
ncbi:MAG: DoxX family protein [Thermoanaerobaculia bacterium]